MLSYRSPESSGFCLYYSIDKKYAPVVQWIEHQPSKLAMGVRFSPGVHLVLKTKLMLIIFLQIIFFLALILFAIFFVIQAYNILIKGRPPYVSTKKRIVKKIIEELDFKDSDGIKVYEIGCGKANFLRTFRKKYKKIKLVGIEYSFLPISIARFLNFVERSKIKLLKENYFKSNFSDAVMIYCYLGVNNTNRLAERFKKECKPGTIIVSFQFRIDNFEPYKVIKSKNNKERIYFYTIINS